MIDRKRILFLLISSAFILAMGQSCSHQQDAHTGEIALIQEFFVRKKEVVTKPTEGESYQVCLDSLEDSFQNILEHQATVVPYLLSLQSDTSQTFYVLLDSYPIIWGSPNTNSLNALFLIEAIIRKDFLFNRRGGIFLGEKERFRCERFNSLFDSVRGKAMTTVSFFELAEEDSQDSLVLDSAWRIYQQCFQKYEGKTERITVSPLRATSIRWNSI